MQGSEASWLLLILMAAAFLFLPQWMARRRQKKKLEMFEVGDRVITIGGFIGTLTMLDREANVARLELAEGVEVEIVPGALGRKLIPAEAEDADGV